MDWLNEIKDQIPDYAKDIKLNLDNVITKSTLPMNVVLGCALASAIASGSKYLKEIISNNTEDKVIVDAAHTAAFLMAQNNMWYPYVEMTGDANLKGLPAQLRMQAIATHGGTDKSNFEAFSLAASIVGKCNFCVKAHYETLKKENYSLENLRDIGRIAATIYSVSRLGL